MLAVQFHKLDFNTGNEFKQSAPRDWSNGGVGGEGRGIYPSETTSDNHQKVI